MRARRFSASRGSPRCLVRRGGASSPRTQDTRPELAPVVRVKVAGHDASARAKGQQLVRGGIVARPVGQPPGPFGFPVPMKFAQYARICSEGCRCAAVRGPGYPARSDRRTRTGTSPRRSHIPPTSCAPARARQARCHSRSCSVVGSHRGLLSDGWRCRRRPDHLQKSDRPGTWHQTERAQWPASEPKNSRRATPCVHDHEQPVEHSHASRDESVLAGIGLIVCDRAGIRIVKGRNRSS